MIEGTYRLACPVSHVFQSQTLPARAGGVSETTNLGTINAAVLAFRACGVLCMVAGTHTYTQSLSLKHCGVRCMAAVGAVSVASSSAIDCINPAIIVDCITPSIIVDCINPSIIVDCITPSSRYHPFQLSPLPAGARHEPCSHPLPFAFRSPSSARQTSKTPARPAWRPRPPEGGTPQRKDRDGNEIRGKLARP